MIRSVQSISKIELIRMARRGEIQDDELEFIGMCEYCNFQRPLLVVNDYVSSTCLNSHCQEANYRACVERAAQKRRRKSK